MVRCHYGGSRVRAVFKKVVGVAAVFVAVVVGIGFVLPTTTHAEASVLVNAPPAAIYPDLASLKAWQEWTSWNTREDPSWNPQYSGPEGAGNTSTWTSSSTGAGSQTITEGDPATGVRYRVDAGPVVVDGRIALAAEGAATRVTWTDELTVKSFGMRYFVPLMGPATRKDMEASLAALKARAEAGQR
jgi:hypothetical protein